MVGETYGQMIARRRRELGMTQPQLAEASGVPMRTLQDLEGDKRKKPQRATVLRINQALEVEGDPNETRANWPADVQVFLDIMGAFLANMPEARRLTIMREIVTHVLPES